MTTNQMPSANTNHISGPERINALTDGITAIVLTLLVLLIEPPKGHESFPELMNALFGMRSLFLAYLVAFIQVALYWKRQHALFDLLDSVDRNLLWLTMGFLMVVVFVPFPTALLCQYFDTAVAGGVTAIFASVHVVCSAILWSAWHYAKKHALLKTDATLLPAQRQLQRHLSLSCIGYLVAIPLAFVDEHLALFMILLTALVELLPAPDH